jgi:hypothetical protein
MVVIFTQLEDKNAAVGIVSQCQVLKGGSLTEFLLRLV